MHMVLPISDQINSYVGLPKTVLFVIKLKFVQSTPLTSIST